MCPGSYFDFLTPPADMETYAVSGPDDVKTLDYQSQIAETVFGQDCGSYSVRFSPAVSYLTV